MSLEVDFKNEKACAIPIVLSLLVLVIQDVSSLLLSASSSCCLLGTVAQDSDPNTQEAEPRGCLPLHTGTYRSALLQSETLYEKEKYFPW